MKIILFLLLTLIVLAIVLLINQIGMSDSLSHLSACLDSASNFTCGMS